MDNVDDQRNRRDDIAKRLEAAGRAVRNMGLMDEFPGEDWRGEANDTTMYLVRCIEARLENIEEVTKHA